MVLESQPSNRDTDFQDLERHDLLTGEPRYVEDEIRNTTLALVFAGLGFVFALISMIMMWVLYRRDKNRTFLWHAIWMTLLTLFFIICLVWSLGAKTAVSSGRQPTVFLTLPVFLLSIFFIGYLLVESIWLILYRKVHFDFLVGSSTNTDAWNDRTASGYNFTEAWRQHRRMLWWIVFFNLAAAVALAFIAYAARSVSWNRYSLARVTLYFSLIMMALAAFLMNYWVEEAYEYKKVVPGDFVGNLLTLTKAWAIVALVLTVLNAAVNMIHSKSGYFLMGVLQILLLVAMVMTVGLLLREVRVKLFSDFYPDCTTTLQSIHQEDLNERWCAVGEKYLNGDSCRKSDLVNRWETDNSIISLNSGCCDTAKFFLLYPFMLVGFWTLVCIFCAGVAAACNLYLADTNEYLSNVNKSIGLVDIVGLALLAIMLIAWGIYFIARKSNTGIRTNNLNSLKDSYNNPAGTRIPNFDVVPDAIKTVDVASTLSSDDCIGYLASGQPLPTFSTDAAVAACNNPTDCLMRVALLTKDSNIVVNNEGGSSKGSAINRQLFFPACTSSANDYVLYTGTQDQIGTLLKTLRVCPTNPTATTVNYLMYVDQVKAADLDKKTGQLPSENPGGNVVSNLDGLTCGNTYAAAKTCAGKCKLSNPMVESTTTAPLKGKLYYLQGGVKKFDIHNQVNVKVYKRNDKIGGTSTLYDNGIFTVLNIPRQTSNAYIVTVDINDPVGVFLRKKVDVVVEASTTSETEISAGYIRLDTLDGTICKATDTACISGMKAKTGNINLKFKDASGEFLSDASAPVTGVDVRLLRWNKVTGDTITQGTVTAADGSFTFANVPYDSYTVLANKTGFRPTSSYVDVQDATVTVPNIAMRPTVEKWDMRTASFIDDPSIDFDLNMLIRSHNGAECTITPVNKYCPYAAHMNDVQPGEVGEENILVKNLTVSTYLAWVSPAPSYKGSCPAATAMINNKKLYHAERKEEGGDGWNWDTFKLTRSLTDLNIETSTFGKQNKDVGAVFTTVDVIKLKEVVESDSEAKTKKRIINRDSQPILGTYMEDTSFKAGESKANAAPMLDINGTISSNTTTPISENDCTGTLTKITYNNNTAQGYISCTKELKMSVCKNGTNITDDTASFSFYGLDKSRWDVQNRSFTLAHSTKTSTVLNKNSNFSYPNDTTFTLVRNKDNNQEITGVNTGVTSSETFAINKANTNRSYNDEELLTFNSEASKTANTSVRTVTETEFKNSVQTTNFNQKLSLDTATTGKSGTRTTTNKEVFSDKTVTTDEPCTISQATNGSVTVKCTLTQKTTFTDGSTSTVTTNKQETLTNDVEKGPSSTEVHFENKKASSSGADYYSRIEDIKNIVVPSGSNITIFTLAVNRNDTADKIDYSRNSSDIDDANNTFTTSIKESTKTTMKNGTIGEKSFFQSRIEYPNKTQTSDKSECDNYKNASGLVDLTSCGTKYTFTTDAPNSTFPDILLITSTKTRSPLSGSTMSTLKTTNMSLDKSESVDTFNRTTNNVTEVNYTNGSREYIKDASNAEYKLGAKNSTTLTVERNFLLVPDVNQTLHSKVLSKTFDGTTEANSKNCSHLVDTMTIKAISNTNENFVETFDECEAPTRAFTNKVTVMMPGDEVEFTCSSYFKDQIDNSISYLTNDTKIKHTSNYSLFRNISDGVGDSVVYNTTQYQISNAKNTTSYDILALKIIAAAGSPYQNITYNVDTNTTLLTPNGSNQTNYTIQQIVYARKTGAAGTTIMGTANSITVGENKDNAVTTEDKLKTTNVTTATSYETTIDIDQSVQSTGTAKAKKYSFVTKTTHIFNKSVADSKFQYVTGYNETSHKEFDTYIFDYNYNNSVNSTGATNATATIVTDFGRHNVTSYTNESRLDSTIKFVETSKVNSTGSRYNASDFNSTATLTHPNYTNITETTPGKDNFTSKYTSTVTNSYETENPATDSKAQKKCNHTVETVTTHYRNDSKVKFVKDFNSCIMLNNSNVTTITTTYLQMDHASSSTAAPTEYKNVTHIVDGVSGAVTTTNNASTTARRRILMEKPQKAAYSAAHADAADGNFILVSCYTGFGQGSLVNSGAIFTNKPTMQDCFDRLNKQKPDYTVEKLKAKYDEYVSKNPPAPAK